MALETVAWASQLHACQSVYTWLSTRPLQLNHIAPPVGNLSSSRKAKDRAAFKVLRHQAESRAKRMAQVLPLIRVNRGTWSTPEQRMQWSRLKAKARMTIQGGQGKPNVAGARERLVHVEETPRHRRLQAAPRDRTNKRGQLEHSNPASQRSPILWRAFQITAKWCVWAVHTTPLNLGTRA